MEIQEELIALLRLACMWLRKWRSSDTSVMENVPTDMREDEGHQIIAPPAECHKALGLHWDMKKDTLHVSTPTLAVDDNPTKRKIASDVAKTFDLLRWFAPCTIVVKVMLQDLWRLKLAWDDPVPGRIAQAWKDWRDELPLIPLTPYPATTWSEGRKSEVFNFTASATPRILLMLGSSTYVLSTQTRLSPLLCFWPRRRSLPSAVLLPQGRSSTELSC